MEFLRQLTLDLFLSKTMYNPQVPRKQPSSQFWQHSISANTYAGSLLVVYDGVLPGYLMVCLPAVCAALLLAGMGTLKGGMKWEWGCWYVCCSTAGWDGDIEGGNVDILLST